MDEIEFICIKILDGKVFFVIDDLFGKELLDEKVCRLWLEYYIVLKGILKSVKFLIFCWKYILYDMKVKIFFKNEFIIVDISSSLLKLNYDEKMKIWNSYFLNKVLCRKELVEID